MIKEITIRNYKSIHDLTMELGHVNVLIGENGCGKTNILEAVAMLKASDMGKIDTSFLELSGVRVTKPQLFFNSFLGTKQSNAIEFSLVYSGSGDKQSLNISPVNFDDIYSDWVVELGSGAYDLEKGLEWQELVKRIMEASPMDSVDLKNQKLDKSVLSKVFDLLTQKTVLVSQFGDYLIYNIDNQVLRGVSTYSKTKPLGIFGEGLDVLLNDFSEVEWEELLRYRHLISWLDEIIIDQNDKLKFKGHKLGRSNSILYFRDKFMRKNNNVFAAENSNEGILHILFYLALFISKKTPKFFAIDNIETALNPKLCRTLMKEIAALAVKHDKQVLITTHNPAILDGINLYDDTQRLFVIARNDEGHTKARRIKMKPEVEGKELKLSEMWMRGTLGGIPTNF